MHFSIKGSKVGDKQPLMKVYKCTQCEIELAVPAHLEHFVIGGKKQCDNPRCRKGKFVKK